jgi:glutaredoxin
MSRTVSAAFAVLLAALFATSAAAQAYRWVDQDGKVHYSQTPPPPSQAARVEKRSAGGSVVESTQLPFATQQAVKNHPVTIYTAESCADPCTAARALLSQRGVPFREVAVADETTRAELKKVSGGDEVPVLSVGRQVTKGYLAELWHTALDSAGYPRSGPPLAAKAQKPEAPPAAEAEAPQPAAAEQAPQQASGRYTPPAPSAKEAQQAAADQAARSGRYAPPAADAKASAPQAAGPYAPK